MKYIKFLSLLSATVATASKCHPDYECCDNCHSILTDDEGQWGVKNGQWCFLDTPKCKAAIDSCKFEALGYACCSHCDSIYTDADGEWGAENGQWCGIPDSCKEPVTEEPSTTKAEKVKYTPTAIWLSWEQAPDYIPFHLSQAADQTTVYILYWIPTRDCNSIASQGGAQSMDEYKDYVNRILKGFESYPDNKIALVIEPDTLGNMITAQSNDLCKNVHNLHKQAISYAVNTLASLDNVQAYIDAAHGRWLGPHVDKVADVIKEILDMAPEGKIRGLSTNVSNYQSTKDEYAYHEKLHAALEKVGIHDMKFIVDTSRNGVDVAESIAKTGTWCNVKGTGFGERPRGNPDPVNMPLLDAYLWLKPGGDSDGSSTGDHADPVCSHEDSLLGAGNAGDWFHEYFVQLVTNANPPIEI
ncbi:glycoside hydrolase family 6 protein [Piromyces sp. E2]|nr:glycoside hydrolase family 6 protein [Piromyces sp. E2]|eukprot:OUM63030.1 glycoside hydrolase family 6 protein [Piromyces sp. E2]